MRTNSSLQLLLLGRPKGTAAPDHDKQKIYSQMVIDLW